MSSFEMLEGRIAPAAIFVSGTMATYTDVDGDVVKVKFSKSILTPANIATVLVTAASGAGEQLQLIDLTALPLVNGKNPASGTSISIVSTKVGAGDGFADVGYIKAATGTANGIPLGSVFVDGDLGQIDAGNQSSKVGIGTLSVKTIGARGLGTQAGTPSLESNVTGSIGAVTVGGDFVDATLKVIKPVLVAGLPKIGSLTIGGKLRVSNPDTNTAPDAGFVSVVGGNIGSVRIGSSPTDGVFGGGGTNSGRINADGTIGSVMVLGDIVGKAGAHSGEIFAGSAITNVRVDGGLHGGAGASSGRISAGPVGTVVIGKTVLGGSGTDSGEVEVRGNLGSLTVKNTGGAQGTAAVSAGAGKQSGAIIVKGNARTISLGGSLDATGAALESAGTVQVLGNLGSFIAGSVKGGSALTTGSLTVAGNVSSMFIGGDVTGGAGENSGKLSVSGTIGTVTIVGEIHGGGGKSSGRISTSGITKAVVGKTIIGGSQLASGGIEVRGNLGSLTVKNTGGATAAVSAGTGQQSGAVTVLGNAGLISLFGNLDGSGLAADNAGSILVEGNVAAFSVSGSLKGGVNSLTGSLNVAGNIASIVVSGDLVGGTGSASGSIAAGGKITSAIVNGRLVGGGGAESGALRAGTNPDATGDIVTAAVRGSVEGGAGNGSGGIHASGRITSVLIGPAVTSGFVPADRLKGGGGDNSGTVIGDGGISIINIRGHVTGGAGAASGSIQANGFIKTVGIAGRLNGAGGSGSGAIVVHDLEGATLTTPGNLGTVSIAGAIAGGAGQNSGQVFADGSLVSLKAGGLTGLAADGSGSIRIGQGLAAVVDDYAKIGNAGSIRILGSIAEAGTPGSASIDVGGRIDSLAVSGSITGALITAGRSLGTFSVGKAGVAGTEVIDTTVSALRQQVPTATVNTAIGTVKIFGNVTDSKLLAGYDRFGAPADGSAQIKTVTVSGDWKGGSIAAGVVDTLADGFANDDDAVIADKSSAAIAKIAKITINGLFLNSAAPSHFGFVSDELLSVIIHGSPVPPTGDIPGTNGGVLQV